MPNPGPYDARFRQVHAIVAYYILLLGAALLFLLDVWGGNVWVGRWLGQREEVLANPLLKTGAYTLIGGVFGSVLFQIRALFKYYLKNTDAAVQYDERWVGKYISAPWESAVMALVVLALIRGGVTLFGGGPDPSATNNFAVLGVGALVGFGMRDVVKWIQKLTETMFAANNNGQDLNKAKSHSSQKEESSKADNSA